MIKAIKILDALRFENAVHLRNYFITSIYTTSFKDREINKVRVWRSNFALSQDA